MNTETMTETLPAPVQPAAVAPKQEIRITVDQLAQLPESDQKREWINSLVQAETARLRYAQDRQFALDAYNSGVFDDLKKLSPQQGVAYAITKQQMGWDYGLSRAEALRSIYIVGGRPALENDVVAARLQAAGLAWDPEFFYQDIDHKGKAWQKCTGCCLWLKQWSSAEKRYVPMVDTNGQQVSVAFTEADADHAMIHEQGKQIPLSQKWNFQSWAKDMYYWKCIARVKKYHAPNVLRGAVIREDAMLDQVPVDQMPAELLPPDLQPKIEAPPEPPRKSLRDQALEQENYLDKPVREPGEGE